MTDLRFPIGRFTPASALTAEERETAIAEIEAHPQALRAAVAGLSDAKLDTPYRDGGWTVRQLVHHIVDSHINVYVRFKLGMTEDAPEIRPYDQDLWANTPESLEGDVDMSLTLADGLHRRWGAYLRTFRPEDWARTVRHPEFDDPLTMEFLLQFYNWHGAHHLAHITELRRRNGW